MIPDGAKRVFFAEDNPDHAFLIRRILHDLGLASVHAATGDEALRLLRAWDGPPPSLILLDHEMPGASGIDVLDAVRADPRLEDVPVALFSSAAAPQTTEAAFEHRADSVVQKPRGLQEFHEVLTAMARHWTVVRPGTGRA